MKVKRIKISLKSAYRYCTKGYWNNSLPEWLEKVFLIIALIIFILIKIILFIPYIFLDIIFSIFIAPFMKQIDKYEE